MDPALHELIATGRPSDEVAVLLRLDHGVVPEGARIVAHLRGSAKVGMTTDEIMALTRGE